MTMPLRPTWVQIDLGAVADNIRFLRANLTGGARLMAVVKADAYGHGAVPVARAALMAGATALGVATCEEGIELREGGIDAPVLILGATSERAAPEVVRYGLTQTVFDAQAVRRLGEAAVRQQKEARVHLKVDSGMGRIGVRDARAMDAVVAAADGAQGVALTGVFTHFATAGTGDVAFVREQHARFMPLAARLSGRPGLAVHAANSAATLRYPFAHHDLVRTGIAMYIAPGPRPAMRWVTRAVQVKTVAPGETVGYGRMFAAGRPTRVMSLPVGYADGYHRQIGGRGAALVRGRRAPVIGCVCMDQALLDVTDIPGAQAGDEVVLLGAQGGEVITAAELGAWCGMIDYEAVLSPAARVPRVYTDDA